MHASLRRQAEASRTELAIAVGDWQAVGQSILDYWKRNGIWGKHLGKIQLTVYGPALFSGATSWIQDGVIRITIPHAIDEKAFLASLVCSTAIRLGGWKNAAHRVKIATRQMMRDGCLPLGVTPNELYSELRKIDHKAFRIL